MNVIAKFETKGICIYLIQTGEGNKYQVNWCRQEAELEKVLEEDRKIRVKKSMDFWGVRTYLFNQSTSLKLSMKRFAKLCRLSQDERISFTTFVSSGL